MGSGRTGVPDPDAALRVATAIAAAPLLARRGVQGYGGNWQHIGDPSDRHTAVAEGMQRLTAAIELLVRHGAGSKAFATDAGAPTSDIGAYLCYGDEQRLLLTDHPGRPALGSHV
ncbi:hypothetical protein AB0H49_33145 [Nocardia sp. NPDC050713]|uniref:hypothetical protein n=1 Tax=Nocardia sp. NPDC050713 TaxID=3154511 RepID=UPI0033BFD27F